VGRSFDNVLADFSGTRALFVHDALSECPPGYAGEMDEDAH
jgi:hypothetical protein